MEEIIIDGVDVKKCPYMISVYDLKSLDNYIPRKCEINGRNDCKDNPKCYYKQLKRKEKQCEELKENVKHKELEIQDWIKQYKLAHQKRIKLQTKYNKLEQKANKYIHDIVDENVKDISDISKVYNSLEKQNAILKQALQEIKALKESQNIKDDVYKMICEVLSEVEE